MNLYGPDGEHIADIELRIPADFTGFREGRVFRVALEKRDSSMPHKMVTETVYGMSDTFKVAGFQQYRDGVMLVEGTLEDIEYAYGGPRQLRDG